MDTCTIFSLVLIRKAQLSTVGNSHMSELQAQLFENVLSGSHHFPHRRIAVRENSFTIFSAVVVALISGVAGWQDILAQNDFQKSFTSLLVAIDSINGLHKLNDYLLGSIHAESDVNKPWGESIFQHGDVKPLIADFPSVYFASAFRGTENRLKRIFWLCSCESRSPLRIRFLGSSRIPPLRTWLGQAGMRDGSRQCLQVLMVRIILGDPGTDSGAEDEVKAGG